MRRFINIIFMMLFFLLGCTAQVLKDQDPSNMSDDTIIATQDNVGGNYVWRLMRLDSLLAKISRENLGSSEVWIVAGSEIHQQDSSKTVRVNKLFVVHQSEFDSITVNDLAMFGTDVSSGMVTVKGNGSNILSLLTSAGSNAFYINNSKGYYYLPVTFLQGVRWGDEDTQLTEVSDDKLVFVIAGSQTWEVNASELGSVTTGQPQLRRETSTITNATVVPNNAYPNNGLGGAGTTALIVDLATILNATASSVDIYKDILPYATGVIDIGSPSLEWDVIYAEDVVASNGAEISNELSIIGNLKMLNMLVTDPQMSLGNDPSNKAVLVWDTSSEEFYIGNNDSSDPMYFGYWDSPIGIGRGGANVMIGGDPVNISGSTSILGLNTHTSIPSFSFTNAAGLFASTLIGVPELFAQDGNGNNTQLSEHATDAPEWLSDNYEGIPDRISRELNWYVGSIRWVNKSRSDRLDQMRDLGQALPEDSLKLIRVYQESFAEYNLRTGNDLQVRDWDKDQEYGYQQSLKRVAQWERKSFLIDSLNKEVQVGDSLKNVIQAKRAMLNRGLSNLKTLKKGSSQRESLTADLQSSVNELKVIIDKYKRYPKSIREFNDKKPSIYQKRKKPNFLKKITN